MDCIVHGVTKSWTRLGDFHFQNDCKQLFWGGFLCGLAGKESACNTGDLGLIPGSGRSPGEGNGNPFQYSCLENSMDGGDW